MSLICDGTSIEAVVFNDERMTELWFDDTIVWENPLFYNPLDDGSGYSVRLGDTNITGAITIADTFNGEPVVAIDDDAFKGASGITSLYVPSSITSYGYRFLQGCSGLTNITLPFIDKSLSQYFGSYTGSTDGISINSVTITGGTSICASAFSGCNSITSVQITAPSITSIGEDAFYSCSGLKEVNIPSSVTSIGDNAFTGCKELTTIIIPDSVATIGGNAFGGCSKATIYCEAASQPSGWHNRWNGIESTGNAVPAYFYAEHTSSVGNGTYWHYVNGVPTVWSHSYRSVVTAPTCTAQGYTTYTCSVCGRVYKGDYVAALGHAYSKTKVDATCTEQGYDSNTCTRCGDTYQSNYIDALGHSYGEWTITLEPTCIVNGTQRADCIRCDHYKTEVVTKLGHTYSTIKVDPTCDEQGYDLHTCTRCGDVYMDAYTDALGHDWVVATCTTPQTCRVCGATSGEALGHNEIIDPAIPATCTTAGKTAGSHCSRCSKVFTPQQTIPATGHTEGNWIVDVEPTTTTTGSQHTECTVCGITLKDGTLPKRLKEPPYEYYSVTNRGKNEDGKIELRAYARNPNDSDVDCYAIVFDSNGVSYSTQRFTIAASGDYTHIFLVSSSFDGSTFEMYFTANGYSDSESVFGTIS